MPKRLFILLAALSCLFCAPAFAQMTDDAIIAYLKEGVAAGKTESQLGKELIARGVSMAQITRLAKTYKQNEISGSAPSPVGLAGIERTRPEKNEEKTDTEGNTDEDDMKGVPSRTGKKVPGDSIVRKMIYGHDMFRNRNLSFEPNENVATPADYILGPGDEIIIDIWGSSEASLSNTISPDGNILVSGVGRIALSGLTIAQATTRISREMSKRYSALEEGQASQISVTLGKLRSIQVNILGEVRVPGTYRLSSFSTVFNALYRAGGLTPSGSLRGVKIMRSGREVASVDVYDYLFNGRQSVNARLKEGDVIIVPVYSALVSIDGGVKRPMFYELKKGETLKGLVDYAGGYSADAHRGDISVRRNAGKDKRFFSVPEDDLGSFAMADGDSVSVSRNLQSVYTNMAEVRGAVYRPGKFEIGSEIATVRQLVTHSGGLLENAFVNRAQIIREKADRSLEVIAIPLEAIMDGKQPDVALRKNDILIISDKNKVEEKGDVSIMGYVTNPGKYQYAENTSIEDLILLAGGLVDGASTARVDVSRRIHDASSTQASDTLARVFSFSIKGGLVVDADPGFVLRPYDVVAVRRSPTYSEQRIVTISGEVLFPGQYTLRTNDERLSTLISRAGGVTANGNIRGGLLRRRITQDERNTRVVLSKIAQNKKSGRDSLNVGKLAVSEIFNVGVEMDRAVANPGSLYDVELRDGDEIIIPPHTTTVRIQGEVLFPNTVQYVPGKSVRYYVNQAGGFGNLARRNKVFVVYMNGLVSAGMDSKIEPGCEIVIPSRPESAKLTAGEWIGIGSSAASLSTMVATLVNLFKK